MDSMANHETPWLSETEQCVWRRWLNVSRRMNSALAKDMQRDSGLSLADYEVLVNLSEAPDHRMRVVALAERLTWEKSRLSHQITRMMRRDLLSRENCASDGRGAFVTLTPEGLETIRQAAPAHVEAVRRLMFDNLSATRLRQLSAVLDDLSPQFEED